MNKAVKYGVPLIVVLLFGAFWFDIGSSPIDYEGEVILEQEAPGTYQMNLANPFFYHYNVYAETGMEVGVEVINELEYSGASYQTCEDYQECDIIEENAPLNGFECIGKLYGGDAEMDTYTVRFTMSGNETSDIVVRQVEVQEEFGTIFRFIPILAPLLIFVYVSALIRGNINGSSPNKGKGTEKTDYSQLSSDADGIEQRFRKFQDSENFDSRIRYEEGVLKVVVGGNSSGGKTVGMLFGSLIALLYVFNGLMQGNGPMIGMATFVFAVLFLFFLNSYRGEQTMFVYDDHVEVRYDRMNYNTPEMHQNTLIADITEIKHYSRWVNQVIRTAMTLPTEST